MNIPADDAARRCRILLDALKSLIECATIVEEDSTQLASALFMCVELQEALEKLINLPTPLGDPANDPA